MESASYGGGVIFVKQMIVILSPSLPLYNSFTVVQIEGMNYGSDKRIFERFVPLISDSISVRESFISQFSV